jgi:hypothetical protein
MSTSLIPRRLTQPKTLLVLVIAVIVIGFISLKGESDTTSNVAVKPGVFAPGEKRRSDPNAHATKSGPTPTEDGNIDYCEILREPVLLNQRSHWDNFAENPKGRLETPERSEGDIGNWYGTLAYFSSIDVGDLENPNRFFTSCELACARNENCISFLYERYMTEIDNHKYIDKHKDRCYLNSRFQYGIERLPQVDKKEKLAPGEKWNGRSWTAGWHRERSEKWLIEQQGCTRPVKKPSRKEREAAEARAAEEARQREEEEAAAAARAKQEAAQKMAAGAPPSEETKED